MKSTTANRRSAPYRLWYRFRGTIFFAPIIFLLFCQQWHVNAPHLIWPAGLLVFLSGIGIRYWAQLHLHFRLDHKALTMTGPYQYTRNSIYIGNTLILLGLCIVSGLLWFFPVLVALCATVYSLVVRYEEAHLLEKYGSMYAEYLAKVPRWLPKKTQTSDESGKIQVKKYLLPALFAEAHNLLLILPFIAKEYLNLH